MTWVLRDSFTFRDSECQNLPSACSSRIISHMIRHAPTPRSALIAGYSQKMELAVGGEGRGEKRTFRVSEGRRRDILCTEICWTPTKPGLQSPYTGVSTPPSPEIPKTSQKAFPALPARNVKKSVEKVSED